MMGGSINHDMIDDATASVAQEYANDFGKPGFDDPTKMYIDQRYEGYTQENQETWSILYGQQMDFLQSVASNVYLDGAKAINLVRTHIPTHQRGSAFAT